jgi:hypothetical protein
MVVHLRQIQMSQQAPHKFITSIQMDVFVILYIFFNLIFDN